jgi:hypothetical protein
MVDCLVVLTQKFTRGTEVGEKSRQSEFSRIIFHNRSTTYKLLTADLHSLECRI